MSTKKKEESKKETWYPFRSLENYKSTQAHIAAKKGKTEQLKAAPTLTAARRIVFGK